MISICRKLSRDWNNFELMISICRKLSRGRNKKKKVPALAQLFQPPTNCNPKLLEEQDVMKHARNARGTHFYPSTFYFRLSF